MIAMVDDFDPRCIHNIGPDLVKVAWARNWFERWCERALSDGGYDLYLASSQLSARYISDQLDKLAPTSCALAPATLQCGRGSAGANA
ncbi:MAG: hypothetical protein H7240_00930 [Glaciimonas sp.]|nr:hypothetical protein [Glaciimonas sp.]